MSTSDIKLVLSSACGKDIYINATISRALARQIETMLENNGVVMTSSYNEPKKKNRIEGWYEEC